MSFLNRFKKPYIFWPLAAVYPIILYIITEYTAGGTIAFPFRALRTAPLSWLPPVLLLALFFFAVLYIVRRAWPAAALTALPPLTLAIVNYYRFYYTNMPLTPADFYLAGQINDILGFSGALHVPFHFFTALAFLALYAACLHINRVPLRPAKQTGRYIAAACALLFAIFWGAGGALLSPCIKETRSLNAAYQTNGFLACFLNENFTAQSRRMELTAETFTESEPAVLPSPSGAYSVMDAEPPLSENPADAVLTDGDLINKYADAVITSPSGNDVSGADTVSPPVPDNPGTSDQLPDIDSADEAPQEDAPTSGLPDILIVLSEAYWNPKLLPNLVFSENPTRNFDRLAAESLTGYMVSSTIGGNTVHPEFEILTGATADILPSQTTNPYTMLGGDVFSIASYLKSMGYKTIGLHTFNKGFYRRDEAYPRLGFDTWLGLEDVPFDFEYYGSYVPDSVILRWIKDILDASDTPCFIMAITMQCHGPYYYPPWSMPSGVKAADGATFTDTVWNTLRAYIAALGYADQMLSDLTGWLSARERSAALLFLGDHLPFLNNNPSGYTEGGFLDTVDEARWTDAEFLKMHQTPFLIWQTHNIEPRNTGSLAPYFLGGLLLEEAGLPLNDFYRSLRGYRMALPVSRRFITIDADGSIIPGAYTDDHLTFREWHNNYSRSLLD